MYISYLREKRGNMKTERKKCSGEIAFDKGEIK